MSSQEIEQMVLDNRKLVYYIVNQRFYDLRHDDDVIQSGMIGLWRACLRFDHTKGEFSTFACHCIFNEISGELRSRKAGLEGEGVLSLDEPCGLDKETGSPITRGHMIADKRNDYSIADYDLSCVEKKMSERDFAIFKMYIAGFTVVEIGEIFGFSRAWASKIIQTAQAKARKVLQPSKYL